MNTLSKIKEVYGSIPIGSSIKIAGWVRSIRSMGKVCFLSLHDGSCFKAIQVVIYESCPNFDLITKISIGASIYVDGIIEKSVGKEQSIELIAKKIEISGLSPTDYPLQKKAHSMEFLREKAHLRGRTNTFTATFKVRSCISFAIHKFFNQEGFMCVNTPVITGSDCEGAGEMFKLANNDSNEESFFDRDAFLTVSGQLQAEALALSCGNIYSFGPTFRAEKSNTARHASEFWMVEPEMPFYDLDDTIRLAESMIKFIVNEVKENCYEELCFFQKFIDPMVLERINNVLTQSFKRISYTEAIDLLQEEQPDSDDLNIIHQKVSKEYEDDDFHIYINHSHIGQCILLRPDGNVSGAPKDPRSSEDGLIKIGDIGKDNMANEWEKYNYSENHFLYNKEKFKRYTK